MDFLVTPWHMPQFMPPRKRHSDFMRFLLVFNSGISEIPPMKFIKGSEVLVRDCGGLKRKLLIWEDRGEAVFVASSEVYRLLEAGQTRLWPVGVPKGDVSLPRGRAASRRG